MGGSAGDGRLDLDELGEVIDHARPLDVGRTDDLVEGHDGATWRERLESAGVTPRLRRHRRPLTAVAVVVLLAGVAATSWQRSLPPPIDPEIRASARDAMPDGSVQFGDGTRNDVVSATVVVTAATPGDVVVVRGLDGPGIRASTAKAGAPGTAGTLVELTLVAGCDDPSSFDPSPDAYRLRVTRTDRYGRSTDGWLPVPGTISAQLVQSVGGGCFQRLLAERIGVVRLDVASVAARWALRLDVGLRNGSAADLAVFGIGSVGATVATSNDPVALLAGTTTTVPVTAVVLDCRRPRLDQVTGPFPASASVDGVSLYASPIDSVTGTGGQIVVAWTPDQQAQVQRALDRMCVGAPDATATVLDAVPAPPAVGAAFGFGSGYDGVGMRLRLDVRTSGTHVALADGSVAPVDLPTAGSPQLTSASADVVGGRAVVTVDWAAPCNGTANPPPVQLTVTAHGRTYPVRAVLDQQVLARAYAAACPQLSTDDLQSYGWPPPAWRPTP